MIASLIGLLAFLLVFVGSVLVWLLASEVQNQQRQNHRGRSGKKLRYQLAKSRREFIGMPEIWHWKRVTKPHNQHCNAVKPNPKLNRWGAGGDTVKSIVRDDQDQVPTQKPKIEPISEVVSSEMPDLAALAETKRKQFGSPPASPVTKNRLDSLTKDRRVSDRLVQRLKLANPDRSEQWVYEKAIYDVERDRL